MGRRDVKSQVEFVVLHTKAQYTSTQSIQDTNLEGFHGAAAVADIGAHTADDLTVTLQHRDGTDSWVDVPDSDLDGTNDKAIVAADANTQVYWGYTGNKEQLGAVITDGGSGDAVVGVYVIKGYPSQIPVN